MTARAVLKAIHGIVRQNTEIQNPALQYSRSFWSNQERFFALHRENIASALTS